ncbi:MAG: cyclic nucleotide-binding domain-containing protein [Magnetospirillum sp.]|nr:cyclic nucleotide-binding domain-containing protein [Magnetospirillum sp.]
MFDTDIPPELRATPLFSGLADKDLRELLDGAVIIACPRDHGLYAAGDPVETFYVVLDGHVELSTEREGRRSVVEVARKGTVLGDAALFGGRRFLMSARVIAGARLLSIPAAPFLDKLETRFDIILHMLSAMSVRLRMQVRQIAELKLKTTAQRLGSFILSLTQASSGAAVIRFPYDKKLVAEELGMKPESLSRALARLAAVEVRSLPDNAVSIADVGRLRRFCIEEETP